MSERTSIIAYSDTYAVVNNQDSFLFAAHSRKEVHDNKLLHRSVHLFIETQNGGFVLQKKGQLPYTENKGKWSSAVSGHVQAYESYESAATREAKEELNLDIPIALIKKIHKEWPSERNGFEFSTLFLYVMDTDKNMPRVSDEVAAVLILPLHKIIEDIEKHPDKYSPPFKDMFSKYLVLEKNIDE